MTECTHAPGHPCSSRQTKHNSTFQTSDPKFETRGALAECMMKKPLNFYGMFKLRLGTILDPNQPTKSSFHGLRHFQTRHVACLSELKIKYTIWSSTFAEQANIKK